MSSQAARERKRQQLIFLLNTLPGNQTQPCALGLDLTWKAKMGQVPGKQHLLHRTGEGHPSPRNQEYITGATTNSNKSNNKVICSQQYVLTAIPTLDAS